MKLSKVIAKRFEDKLEEYFQKEKIDKDFLSAEQYNSCLERAMAWIQMSFDETKDSMATDAAYPMAVHREKDHGEETLEEQASLLSAGADPEMGTMAFWSQ